MPHLEYIPNVYRELFPGGPAGPLRWQDEVSGVLPKAVLAYFDYMIGKGPPLLRLQLKLVLEYARYYLDAPCWDWNPHLDEEGRAELAALRGRVAQFTPETPQVEAELDRWVHDCLDFGIDPF